MNVSKTLSLFMNLLSVLILLFFINFHWSYHPSNEHHHAYRWHYIADHNSFELLYQGGWHLICTYFKLAPSLSIFVDQHRVIVVLYSRHVACWIETTYSSQHRVDVPLIYVVNPYHNLLKSALIQFWSPHLISLWSPHLTASEIHIW